MYDNENLNNGGDCNGCRKQKYCKKPCTQRKQFREMQLNRIVNESIASTPAGHAMTYMTDLLMQDMPDPVYARGNMKRRIPTIH